MNKLTRFGVSIDENLLLRFDASIQAKNYQNRSEAIRDLIRNALVEEEWSKDDIIAGGITLVYDHHRRQLVNKLIDIQHRFHDLVIASQHVHLDHDNCLEIIGVKGHSKDVKALYYNLKSTKGIKHIDILTTTTGHQLT